MALDLHSSSRTLADLMAMDLESVCSTSIPSLMTMTVFLLIIMVYFGANNEEDLMCEAIYY